MQITYKMYILNFRYFWTIIWSNFDLILHFEKLNHVILWLLLDSGKPRGLLSMLGIVCIWIWYLTSRPILMSKLLIMFKLSILEFLRKYNVESERYSRRSRNFGEIHYRILTRFLTKNAGFQMFLLIFWDTVILPFITLCLECVATSSGPKLL